MVVVLPFVWGLIRRSQGMPMFGAPTVAELEGVEPATPEVDRVTMLSGSGDDQSQLP
jgi:hypothetical protein